MALVAHQPVWLADRGSKRAILELHDDRVVVALADSASGARLKTVADVALADLRAEQSQTGLTLIGPGSRNRVDFVRGSTAALLVGGLAGAAIHRAANSDAGIDRWVAALVERGVPVKKTSGRRAWVFAAVVLVVVAAVAVVLSLNGLL